MDLIRAAFSWSLPPWLALGLIALNIVLAIAALGWVPSRRRKPAVALGWLVAIFFIPYIGLLAFLLFANDRLPARRMEMQRHVDELLVDRFEEERAVLTDADISHDARVAASLSFRLGKMPLVDGNDLELVTDNHETMRRMARDVDAAVDYVHFQCYIVAIDDSSAPLLEAMLRAHERGVTVRILIDHIGSAGYPGYPELVRRLDDSGVPWRRMLPVRPWKGEWQRPDLRNHRKILVVDDEVAWTGSQNIIDRSYNKKRNRKRGLQWKDIMIRTTGPVVAELDAVFSTDWYAETEVMLADDAGDRVRAPVGRGTSMQVLPSGPGFPADNNLALFNHLIFNANHRVAICSPYFVPDESIHMTLTTVARAGLEVDLYVSETSDHPISIWAQRSYYVDLIRAGVNLHLYPAPTILHTKFVLIDDEISVVGSSNMDVRSFSLDLEVSTMVVDHAFSARMRELELEYRADSHMVDLDSWVQRPWPRKYLENVCRLTSALL